MTHPWSMEGGNEAGNVTSSYAIGPPGEFHSYTVEYEYYINASFNNSGNKSIKNYGYLWDNPDDFLRASFLMNEYYLWVIFAFGFPGNLATIITICRMRHLGSFVLYVVLLAITDNLAILVKILYYQLLLNRVALGSAGCRLLEFLGHFFITYCNWILVMMAIERLIAVRYPFKIQFQSCLTSQKASIAIAVVGLIIAGTYVPVLWASTYDTQNVRCTKEDPDLLKAIHWTSVSLYAFIPFTLLVICNVLIAREIRISFRLRNSFRSISNFMINRRSCDIPVQRQIMVMLFTATFMFLLLHFPICAFLLAHPYWTVTEHTKAFSVKYFCQQLAYVLCDSNHAFNFYLYFLSARKFRKHFMHMVMSCPRQCRCSHTQERESITRRNIRT